MCCCNHHRGHRAHGHHTHGSCGCGSRDQACGEKGHPQTHLYQALQDLQTRVQIVEEQLASEQEAE